MIFQKIFKYFIYERLDVWEVINNEKNINHSHDYISSTNL